MSVSKSVPRTLARNTIASWLSYAVTGACALVLTPLIIKGVGASGYGVWILLVQLTGYAGILDLGVQPAVVKHVAHSRAIGDREGLRTLLSTAVALHSAIAVIVLALLLGLSFFLRDWFDLGGVSFDEARTVLALVAVSVALGFPASVFSAALKGYLRFDLVSGLVITAQLVRAAGVLLILATGGGLVGLAWASVASSAVGLVGGAFFLYRESSGIRLRPAAVSSPALKKLFVYGLYCFLASLGWFLAYASGALIIGATLTASDIAQYGLATSLLAIVSGLVVAFSQSLMPIASEYEATGRLELIQKAYLIGTRVSLLIVLPLAMVLVLVGATVLSVWVGPELADGSGRLLRLLAIATIISTANGPAIQVALGIGLQRRAAVISISEGIASVALCYVLAVKVGVMGVAIGMLASAVLFQGIVWPISLSSILRIGVRRYWADALKPTLLPVVPSVLIYAALAYATGTRIPALLLAFGLVTAAAYWCAAFFTSFSAAERAVWRERAMRLFGSRRATLLATDAETSELHM